MCDAYLVTKSKYSFFQITAVPILQCAVDGKGHLLCSLTAGSPQLPQASSLHNSFASLLLLALTDFLSGVLYQRYLIFRFIHVVN